ncbi:3-dehydroquinate synthase [Patescibacteria group bacterium]|nr:3-dehydroquinate synthase [Patescibacteria group bacterium]
MEQKIRIRLLNDIDRSYNTVIGRNILNKIGNCIKSLNIGRDIFIITDRKVGRLYGQKLIKSLQSAGFSDIGQFRLDDGEPSKTVDTYIRILEKIHDFDKNQEKKIVIVTLGGGVVEDLGGFAASTYRRGVSYVQIPTTLLGQVDCGLGGKVGVNLKEGKNLVGGFWQPKLACMDLAVLKTLDARELKSGLAEVIKYGVIKDSNLFKYVEEHLEQILHCDFICLKHIILTCVKIKAKITEIDERDEKDIRIILNFGHTIGHAIEAASHYRVYKHGEAISIGMLCAGEIACRLSLLSNKAFSRLDNLIGRSGLPTKITKCSLRNIMKSMRHDKKFVNGANRFVLPVKIGKVKIVKDIDENLIKDVIRKRIVK